MVLKTCWASFGILLVALGGLLGNVGAPDRPQKGNTLGPFRVGPLFGRVWSLFLSPMMVFRAFGGLPGLLVDGLGGLLEGMLVPVVPNFFSKRDFPSFNGLACVFFVSLVTFFLLLFLL